MKCCYCNKELKHSDNYEPFGCDGDFIHVKCLPQMEKYMNKINSMSDDDFIRWIQGLE